MQGVPILALWLNGLGIKVIWNRPRTPQDNAKVERCQGTLGLWTEYKSCQNVSELQEKLSQEAWFYNHTFQDRRQDYTTRNDRFPLLEKTPWAYNPDGFSMELVADFLAEGKWIRAVSKKGQVDIQGQRFSVGSKYQGQKVVIWLDSVTKQWIAADSSKNIIAKVRADLNEKWLTHRFYT